MIPFPKNPVNIINQEQVVNYLNSVCKSTAAQIIDDIHYQIGFKGERFPEYILVETMWKYLTPELAKQVECNVSQLIVSKDELYCIGVAH